MLAIKAHCHAGHIQIPIEGIPYDAKVVVLFLTPDDSSGDLTKEQQASLIMQSQSGFAQNVLLHPDEDCWNDV
jgi:hypothetical protein